MGPDGQAGATGDVSDRRVVCRLEQVAHQGYYRLWQPFIAQWTDRQLVVAFGAAIPGKTDMGDILCSVSSDDGNTWGFPVTIFGHRIPLGPLRFAYANPVLFRPAGQNAIWCFAMRCPLHYRDSEDSHLCAAYSSDGGRSWIAVEPAMAFHSPLIIVAGIAEAAASGEHAGVPSYLLPAHRNTLRHDPRGDRAHFILESTNLLEWRLAGYVPLPAGVFLHEGNIAPGDAVGELKMVMRTARYDDTHQALTPPVAYSSVSVDGGRVWSAAVPEPALPNSVSKAFFGRDALGRHIYVYNSGPAWERRALHYRVRQPGGDWAEARVFFDTGVRNSYPTLLESAPGRFHAVWDSSDSAEQHRTLIRYGRLTL
ncbi:MAG TPA: sialidase family protein [Chloroflexota bacterium]